MLGRFRHENVAVRADVGRPVVAYMGDDRTNGHVYRFVSEDRYTPGRDANRGSMLSRGRLFAAVFNPDGTGEWREIAPARRSGPLPAPPCPTIPTARTLGQVYADLGAMVTDALRASNLIGATPTGRPEDVEVHPLDHSVYIAFTAPRPRPATSSRMSTVRSGASRTMTTARARGSPGCDGRLEALRMRSIADTCSRRRTICPSIRPAISGSSSTSRRPRSTATTLHRVREQRDVLHPDIRTGCRHPAAVCIGAVRSRAHRSVLDAGRETLFLAVQHPGEANGTRMAGMSAPRGSNWPGGSPGDPPRPGVVSIRRVLEPLPRFQLSQHHHPPCRARGGIDAM